MRRPSPSLVVSIVAVAVASAGSATAATVITGNQIRNNSITGADIRNNSITKKDIRGRLRGARGLAGATGAAGPAGVAGPTGPAGGPGAPGEKGDKGDSGGFSAAGTVDQNIDAGAPGFVGGSPGFTAVRREGPGVYCLAVEAGVPVENSNAVATADWWNSSQGDYLVTTSSSPADCNANELQVLTWDSVNGSASDNVAFTVLVP